MTAGHDATLDAATNIAVADLNAGDDLHLGAGGTLIAGAATSSGTGLDDDGDGSNVVATAGGAVAFTGQIGRASCRERVCQYVTISVVAGSLKKKNTMAKQVFTHTLLNVTHNMTMNEEVHTSIE